MRNLSFSRGSENLKWGVVFMLLGACVLSLSAQGRSLLSGKVLSSDKSVIDFATVVRNMAVQPTKKACII